MDLQSLPPPRRPLLLLFHQRFGSFLYASAHAHAIDGGTPGEYDSDGKIPVQIDDEWMVAPGDPDDVQVCGEHSWGSSFLVFADGRCAGTSICMNPEFTGARIFMGQPLKNFQMARDVMKFISSQGKKFCPQNLQSTSKKQVKLQCSGKTTYLFLYLYLISPVRIVCSRFKHLLQRKIFCCVDASMTPSCRRLQASSFLNLKM